MNDTKTQSSDTDLIICLRESLKMLHRAVFELSPRLLDRHTLGTAHLYPGFQCIHCDIFAASSPHGQSMSLVGLSTNESRASRMGRLTQPKGGAS